MPRVPYNSVGGFSTGLTMTGVIDSLGNITGVGATFSGLILANAGISASGATFSGNISAPNIVTSVNGATGSVTTYAGTTGNIQVRYGSGITATNYFSLAQGELDEITDIFTISGPTTGAYSYGNQEAIGLRISRAPGGLGLDESGGLAINVLGIGDDGGGDLYGSSLQILTPPADVGSNIYFYPGNNLVSIMTPYGVESVMSHTFAGPITGVTAAFTGLLSASNGISASGSISLQNQEFIRNTTNGRMDFMPAPAGSTQFGMYMDFTSWSYGVKLGTIRASDNATNAAGFLWDAPLTISTDINFSLGSDGQNGFRNSSVGNRTNQFFTNTASGANSGAFAFVDSAGSGTANRSPGVTHTNPNLYVYRSGSARATDFIRVEHDGTVGRIVSGGTSGILLQPGSGVLAVGGGISASGGFTFGSPSGTTFMIFSPKTSCDSGGLWIRDGNFQVGGSVLGSGNGAFNYSACGEGFAVYGWSTFNNSYNYQSGRSPLRLNGAPTQSVPIFAAYKQTSDGAQLTNTFTTTNMVAGIDQNGALFSTAGVCASGGITFTNNVQANGYVLTSNARSWFL